MSKHRVIEWGKNLIILFLTASAFWLITRSPFYVGSPLERRVNELFSSDEKTVSETRLLSAAARPVSVAVVSAEGRYGVKYNADAVNSVFDGLAPLLGEALNISEEPETIPEKRWRKALGDTGVYLDFGNPVPLNALAEWLRGEEGGTAPSGTARRIILAAGDGKNDVWLFWQDSGTGIFYGCDAGLDRALQLIPSLTAWMPNAAFFAFEDERYKTCDPYALITDISDPAVFEGRISLSASDTTHVEKILEALSYSTASGSSYATSEGTRYTDGVNTFQLTNAGELTYHATEPYYFVPEGEESSAITRYIEAGRQMVEDTIGSICGEAELSLMDVRQEEGTTEITFGYVLDGIPVLLNREGWAAKFLMKDGAVTEFTFYFRSYEQVERTTMLLPELQAAAAMSALDVKGSELVLAYSDNGSETVTAGWRAV